MIKYSHKITIYKILSITIVIALSVLLLFYNITLRDKAASNSSDEMAEGVTIKDSVLEGADKHGKTYIITSESIYKREDNLYHLDALSGFYNIGKLGLEMVANMGLMNDQDKILFLKQDIKIDYGDYKITTDNLEVNLDDMSAKNKDGVEIFYNNSDSCADSFELDTKNNIIHLYGNVKTYIQISDFNR